MTTLRIYDLNQGALAIDLRHFLDLLAPHSLQAKWTVSTVKSDPSGDVWFEATGPGGEKLEVMAQTDSKVSGKALSELAKNTYQVIWGEFVGSLPQTKNQSWVTIRAIDSTFYEISTSDQEVLNRIKYSYKDVRIVDFPSTGR